MARPVGSKNKPKDPLTVRKALRDMDHSFVESMFVLLTSPVDNLPKPKTAMEKLCQHTYEMAIAGDKTSHQYAKLILERAIPQRKQVEHLGETDAQRLGVNINVVTEKSEHEQAGVTIEHESVGREQPHGGQSERGSSEIEPESEPDHTIQ